MQCYITTDKEVISKVFNHPKVYKWITDDCSPKVYEPIIHPQIIYLTDETKNAIIRLDPMNGICCQAHITVLPELWGQGVEFVKSAIRWGTLNTRYMKTIVMIPEYNRLTLRLVEKCGFKQEGILTKSFLKNWQLWNQEIWGLTKQEFYRGG